MTTYGFDVSHYQASLGVAGAKKQGYEFMAAKCTEGTGYADLSYKTFLQQAKDHGMLFAAYHFLRSDEAPTAQADFLASHIIDKSIPVMIDLEPSGASKPTLRQASAFRAACNKRGIRVSLLYFPHFWWDETGQPGLTGWALWQADYGVNPTGHGSAIYPGDGSARWDKQGGVTPGILQFGSRGTIDGYKGDVDLDAYRGDRASLAKTNWFKDYAPSNHPAPPPPPKPVDPNLKKALAANEHYQEMLKAVTDKRIKPMRTLALPSLRHQHNRLSKWLGLGK
jgi:GH25 family lysozyme M1 (1,4-beta-N-acetylmuramidase)